MDHYIDKGYNVKSLQNSEAFAFFTFGDLELRSDGVLNSTGPHGPATLRYSATPSLVFATGRWENPSTRYTRSPRRCSGQAGIAGHTGKSVLELCSSSYAGQFDPTRRCRVSGETLKQK